MKSVLVLGSQVPFNRGGQDLLVSTLCNALSDRGYAVDLCQVPFGVSSKTSLLDQIRIWRSLDLSQFSGQSVDAVICTKFPTYFCNHPRKSLWLVHQHRSLYELFGTRFSDFSDDPKDEALRRLLVDMDEVVLQECRVRATISHTVSRRLSSFLHLSSTPLYPPLPLGSRYRNEAPLPYILSVGRICTIKRIDYLIKALPHVPPSVKAKIVGRCDEGGVMEYLENEIEKHHLAHRVEFLGRVDDEALLTLFSECLAVYYAPFDEDYGYVTLEAFASGKPVVTCTDSGGVLEFVRDGSNGMVVDPYPEAIGRAFRELALDGEKAQSLGSQGKVLVQSLGLLSQSWNRVVETLLPPSIFEDASDVLSPLLSSPSSSSSVRDQGETP
jgi:glycosyltransferase involved in cell wall biosynthesis